MAAKLTGFDAALRDAYSTEAVEGMLHAWTSKPRPAQPVRLRECANCGAPWHDEHQSDSGPCFYCHARRPGELRVGDVVDGRTVVSVDHGKATFDRVADLHNAGVIDAKAARDLLGVGTAELAAESAAAIQRIQAKTERLKAKRREYAERQAELDREALALLATRTASPGGAGGWLRKVLGK